MTPPRDQAEDRKASDLGLLASENFADAEIICGEKTIKLHKAIVCSRSEYFRKALTGPFEESTTGKIKMAEQEPDMVLLALKYIYGGEVDLVAAAGDEPLLTFYVAAAQIADYLLLDGFLESIQTAVGHRCDVILKELCSSSVAVADTESLFPDVTNAIRDAYKWDLKVLQRVFVEFTWAARRKAFRSDMVKDLIKSLPQFAMDLLVLGGVTQWLADSVWAPRAPRSCERLAPRTRRCGNCDEGLGSSSLGNAQGQVYDPFTISDNNDIVTEWCQSCSSNDIIPWREGKDETG